MTKSQLLAFEADLMAVLKRHKVQYMEPMVDRIVLYSDRDRNARIASFENCDRTNGLQDMTYSEPGR